MEATQRSGADGAELESSRKKWDFWSSRDWLWRAYAKDTREKRADAIDRLDLDYGDSVLDVGCGPGTNFELLHEAVGPEGNVVGVDLSPGMVRKARERVDREGWANVEVVRADATTLSLDPESFDGALATTAVSSTPDVRATVENVSEALAPGARFAVYEIRPVPSGVGKVLNPLVRGAYRAIGNWNDEDVLGTLRETFDSATVVDSFALGTNYVAIARKGDENGTATP